MNAYIKTADGVTVYIDGVTYMVPSSKEQYGAVINGIRSGEWEVVREACLDSLKVKEELVRKLVSITGNTIFLDNKPLNNYVTGKILKLKRDGFDINPWLKFLENLENNPTLTAKEELFMFMEHSRLPITEDGCFLAYKYVEDDFMDCHSRTLDYSVGNIVSMPREECCADREVACSTGLHFCSFDYLGTAYNKTVVVLKINPMDVVSIPYDYNNAKGRACKVEVISVYEPKTDNLSKHAVVEEDCDWIEAELVDIPNICEEFFEEESTEDSLTILSVFGKNALVKCECGCKVNAAISTFDSGHGKKCPNCGKVIRVPRGEFK